MTAPGTRDQLLANLKSSSIKVLILLFLNTTLWLLGTLLFIQLEGTSEAEHKCGVKKVQRGFVEDLWQESRTSDEFEWKSSARRRIMQFESEIYSAVEAGVSSSSGQQVWSVANTFLYVFSLSTTIGYGHLTPSQPNVRLLSLLYGMISLPLTASLLSQLATTLTSLTTLLSLPRSHNQDQAVHSQLSISFLLLIFSLFLAFGSMLFSFMFDWEPTQSLYFLFTTISTIGFGDVLPQDSLTFLLSGGYIVLGELTGSLISHHLSCG